MLTDHAHVIALNRFTGELLWDTELDDWRKNYAASSAPLPAGNLVISGVAGGEHGANGFVAAHDQATGKEVWRFWTVPKRGRAGIRNLAGHGHRSRRRADMVHRQLRSRRSISSTGRPAIRARNTTATIARATTSTPTASSRSIAGPARCKWHYQFTPHDLWDWDATQTSVLVDAEWQGSPRQLMLHAARNGFFYVFDRANGTLLLAKPFVRNLTWASGIGADGRPIKLPNQEPTPGRHEGVPVAGRRDQLVLAVVQPRDRPLLRADVREVQHLHEERAGSVGERASPISAARSASADDPKPQRMLKAIDIRTGAIAWELPQPGPAHVVGRDADDGDRTRHLRRGGRRPDGGGCRHRQAAVDVPDQPELARVADDLLFDGRQFIAVAAGANIIAFSIQD